jgi:hypothetical protein
MQNKNEQRAKFLEMITQWKESGLSQKAFYTANNIPSHVFYYWYKVYKTEQQSTDSFLPVKIRPTIQEELISITGPSGIQVRLPMTDYSFRFIKQLLLS